jgi:lysophospholipase L1-like esterase
MAPSWLARLRRRCAKAGVFVLGDRALLRPGGPGRFARALGIRASVYRPHPYTIYELNPEWQSADGRSRHNSLGFRGPEVPATKPPGRLRIVCMGDSTTYCIGINDDAATYPARLEAHLRDLWPQRELEVINAGVGSYTSLEHVVQALLKIAPLSPDLVIYYYSHNDVHARRIPVLSRDYREYSRSWYEPPFGGGLRGGFARRWALASGDIGNLVRRYDEYAGRRGSANIAANPPDALRANMAALITILTSSGSRVMIVNPPYRDLERGLADPASVTNPANRAVYEHRRIMESIGAIYDVPVFDVAPHMPYPSNPKGFPTAHFRDPVHLTESGADLMGRRVAEAVLARGILPREGHVMACVVQKSATRPNGDGSGGSV